MPCQQCGDESPDIAVLPIARVLIVNGEPAECILRRVIREKDDSGEALSGLTRQDFIETWWRGNAGPVPCGDCSACCYYAGIPVDKKRDRKHLPHLLTERNHDGELVLRRRADGGCIHLGERGCMVYQHRPAVCRSFDCRAFAAMGLVEHCAPNHKTPDWEFAARER